MAKKAKLDILEISVDEDIAAAPPDQLTAEKEVEPGSAGTSFSSKMRAWAGKPLFWIILSTVVLLGSISGIFIWYNQGKDREAVVASKGQSTAESLSPGQEKTAILEGFVIDQKDEKGNIRIVLCDIALELERAQVTGAISDRIDVRNVVYSVLKGKKTEEGLLPAGRDRLTTELLSEMKRLLGENTIKAVYFTRYEVN